MSTFAQKISPEFSTFTPALSSDFLGKAMGVKREQYNQGYQKVENTLTSVAGLPVASEFDRDYLQKKINNTVSDLNKMVGTDFSNMNQVNSISGQVSSIANDPNVLTAIASSSRVKQMKTDQKSDTDEYGAQAEFNVQDSEDQFNQWLSTGKPGVMFKGQHTKYTDVDPIVEDIFKKKHPNTKVQIISAGVEYDENGQPKRDKAGNVISNPRKALQQFDVQTNTWKGITAQDVKETLSEELQSRPDILKQLDITAKYSYKGLQPENVIDKKLEVISTQVKQNEESANQIDAFIATLPKDIDPKLKSQYINKRDLLRSEANKLKPALTPTSKNILLQVYHNNPELLEQDRHNIYMDNWYNLQASKFAYGEESVDFKGEGPSHKQEHQEDYKLKLAEHALKVKEYEDKHQMMLDKEAMQRAKLIKEKTDFVTSEGISGVKTDPWNNFNNIMDRSRAEVATKKNTYLYNTFHNEHPEWFKVGPNKEITPMGDEVERQYKLREEAYKNGNNVASDENNTPIHLLRRDNSYFEEIEGIDRVSKAMQIKKEEAEDAWNEKEKTNPVNIARKKMHDEMNSLPQINNEKQKKNNELARSAVEIRNRFKNVEGQISIDEKMNILKEYGFSTKEDYGKALELADKYQLTLADNINYENDSHQFLSDYITSNDYVANPQSTQWVNKGLKNPQIDKTIIDKAIKLVGKNKILKENSDGKGIDVSYIQEPISGNYTLQVKDGDGTHLEFPIAPENVPAEWNNYKDESTLNQLLRVNRDPVSKLSSTHGTQPDNFANALPLTVKKIGNKVMSIKYKVEQEGSTYYVQFWGKDVNNKTDAGTLIKDEHTGVPKEATAESIKELELILDNFRKTGSTNLSTYAASSKDEEPED